MTKDDIVQKLYDNRFVMGRMIGGSKSGYRERFPNNIAIFNANIIIPIDGKIWHGDLDITKDGEFLKKIAAECKTIFYILREMDARFENESRPISELVEHSIWDTTQKVITLEEYRERNR